MVRAAETKATCVPSGDHAGSRVTPGSGSSASARWRSRRRSAPPTFLSTAGRPRRRRSATASAIARAGRAGHDPRRADEGRRQRAHELGGPVHDRQVEEREAIVLVRTGWRLPGQEMVVADPSGDDELRAGEAGGRVTDEPVESQTPRGAPAVAVQVRAAPRHAALTTGLPGGTAHRTTPAGLTTARPPPRGSIESRSGPDEDHDQAATSPCQTAVSWAPEAAATRSSCLAAGRRDDGVGHPSPVGGPARARPPAILSPGGWRAVRAARHPTPRPPAATGAPGRTRPTLAAKAGDAVRRRRCLDPPDRPADVAAGHSHRRRSARRPRRSSRRATAREARPPGAGAGRSARNDLGPSPFEHLQRRRVHVDPRRQPGQVPGQDRRHLVQTVSLGAPSPPLGGHWSTISRSAARPRAANDLTVPGRQPRASAMSASDQPT